MKRILVTGASGLLGINLSVNASKNNQVFGVTYSQPLFDVPFNIVSADLTNELEIGKTIEQANPDLIINCAAMANVDACESDPVGAKQINTFLPAYLSDWCQKADVPFVHFSTDAVFDGIKGNYTEEDSPNPLSTYAKTKLEAEHAVLDRNPDALVMRVNFFGFSVNGKRSLAEFFLYNLAAGLSVNGFTDVFFCPLLAQDLVDILFKMIDKRLFGIYHVVNSQPLSKYDFGVAIAKKFGLNDNLISPISVKKSGLKAKRSQNLTLCIEKLIHDIGESPPDLSTEMERFKKLFDEGYPQQLNAYGGFVD